MAGISTLATHSQSDPSTQLSQTIPALFRTQKAELQASTQASDLDATSQRSALDPSGQAGTSTLCPQPSPLLSLADLQLAALDIKTTLSTAILDLKMDLRVVASQLEQRS